MNPLSPAEAAIGSTEHWHDFYVVIGGAAAGLTGLMFVVVTLGPKVIATREEEGVHGFVTPTVVYFATVLVLACFMVMPGLTPPVLSGILALIGVGGAVYLLSTGAHQQWRKSELGVNDWLWYIGFPGLAYLLLLTSAIELWRQGRFALYATALTAIFFIIIGIRNAWDLVLWMAQQSEAAKGSD